MTEERLKSYIVLKKKILEYENGNTTSYISSPGFDFRIARIGTINNSVEKIAIDELFAEKQYEKDCSECEKIEKWVNDLENIEIKVMIIKRYINGMTWEQIGEQLHLDRTTVSKKVKRYIELTEKST